MTRGNNLNFLQLTLLQDVFPSRIFNRPKQQSPAKFYTILCVRKKIEMFFSFLEFHVEELQRNIFYMTGSTEVWVRDAREGKIQPAYTVLHYIIKYVSWSVPLVFWTLGWQLHRLPVTVVFIRWLDSFSLHPHLHFSLPFSSSPLPSSLSLPFFSLTVMGHLASSPPIPSVPDVTFTLLSLSTRTLLHLVSHSSHHGQGSASSSRRSSHQMTLSAWRLKDKLNLDSKSARENARLRRYVMFWVSTV